MRVGAKWEVSCERPRRATRSASSRGTIHPDTIYMIYALGWRSVPTGSRRALGLKFSMRGTCEVCRHWNAFPLHEYITSMWRIYEASLWFFARFRPRPSVRSRAPRAASLSAAHRGVRLDSTHQIAVEYAPVTVDLKRFTFGREIPFNRAWTPGGRPLTLFINHPVIVGDKELPVGAYTMFVIPSEKQWTLVVSRSTDTSGKY